MRWSEPIVDRTEADAEIARAQQSNSESELKGALNAADLNRIEENCGYIADRLRSAGYHIPMKLKTNWRMEDLPELQNEINRIRRNVLRAQKQFAAMSRSPSIKVYQYLDFEDVNHLEQALLNIKADLAKVQLAYPLCGTAICGEE